MKKLRKVWSVLTGNTEFVANSFVPKFGESLGGFDGKPMKQKVLLIIIRLEKLCRMLARPSSHSYEIKSYYVYLPRLDRCEIICKAKILAAALFYRLTRKSKP